MHVSVICVIRVCAQCDAYMYDVCVCDVCDACVTHVCDVYDACV